VQATHSIWVNLAQISEPAPQLERVTTALSPLVTQIVHNRGIAPEDLAQYLRPDWRDVGDPYALLGMAAAVERVLAARERGEIVAVYGDSDVDGITGTALLVQTLEICGLAAVPYIPHRQPGGAGLSAEGLAFLAARQVKLVVTVDCGITGTQEVSSLAEQDVEVIVTDHHTPSTTLPQAVAIIDPRQPGCTYPCKDLAGVAVAFKLAQALLCRLVPGAEAHLRRLLDLVAIGSIADMGPLRHENRILVWHGLRVLNETDRPGLQALIARSGLHPGGITSTDVGVRICPRLNAAGRLDHAALGYELLTARTYEDAEKPALQLEERNSERQHLTLRVMSSLHEQIAAGAGERTPRLLVLHLEPWAAGVMGLVAGKLVEEYGRPVVVLHAIDGEVRGSARGTPAFDVLAALQANAALLHRFGGHQLAAGFTTSPDRVDALTARLRHRADCLLADANLVPVLEIDADVALRQLTWQLYDQLQALEPCGIGNRLPLFLCKRLKVLDLRRVGNNQLRLTVGRGSLHMTAIVFRRGDLLPYLHRSMLVDLVFHLDANEWNGSRVLQLRVRDMAFEPLDALSATMDLAGYRAGMR
jgi:single-stranded-DNA-specific exonuclease